MQNEAWSELTITVNAADVDTAAAIAHMVVPHGIYIEDYSRLEEESMQIAHIDLIDDELLAKDKSVAIIHIYILPNENPAEALAFLKHQLEKEGVSYTLGSGECVTQDWINNWKKHYRPTEIGKRLLIKPEWYGELNTSRAVLLLDPGLAFGTGNHATTRLCLEVLDKHVAGGESVLDIGCGSGILSIAALLLGAEHATGVDIDPIAVKTAAQNGTKNGFTPPKFTVLEGDLTKAVSGKFTLVLANIVADAIIELCSSVPAFMAPGALFIASGIIDTRESDTTAAFAKANLTVLERHEKDGWLCFVLTKN